MHERALWISQVWIIQRLVFCFGSLPKVRERKRERWRGWKNTWHSEARRLIVLCFSARIKSGANVTQTYQQNVQRKCHWPSARVAISTLSPLFRRRSTQYNTYFVQHDTGSKKMITCSEKNFDSPIKKCYYFIYRPAVIDFTPCFFFLPLLLFSVLQRKSC